MTFNGRVEAQFTIPSATTISVTAGGVTNAVTVATGTYYMTSFVSYFAGALQAQRAPTGAVWTVTLSTGASGTGKITIDAADDTWSITWTSTTLRDLLGFAANISSVTSAQTGTNQARGVWIPDCPLAIDGDPSAAPTFTDKRTTTSPTGVTLGLVGNIRYQHSNVRWTHVARERVWIGAETTVNASWERFVLDTQLGQGLSFFSVCSKVQIYDSNGILVGIYGNSGSGMAGWSCIGIDSVNPTQPMPGFSGLWTVTIPELVTDA